MPPRTSARALRRKLGSRRSATRPGNADPPERPPVRKREAGGLACHDGCGTPDHEGKPKGSHRPATTITASRRPSRGCPLAAQLHRAARELTAGEPHGPESGVCPVGGARIQIRAQPRPRETAPGQRHHNHRRSNLATARSQSGTPHEPAPGAPRSQIERQGRWGAGAWLRAVADFERLWSCIRVPLVIPGARLRPKSDARSAKHPRPTFCTVHRWHSAPFVSSAPCRARGCGPAPVIFPS